MIVVGDAAELPLPDQSVQCVVTSPPYWGLRKYAGAQDFLWPNADGSAWEGALGMEPTPELYVQHLVQVFGEVGRVLRGDGTLWLNLGDSYAGKRTKQLVGVPWMVAFALRTAGWLLRADIVWYKSNPLPESVKDRPTRAHEYVFLLTKGPRYYYDQSAILRPLSPKTLTTFGTTRQPRGDGTRLVKAENYGRDVPLRIPKVWKPVTYTGQATKDYVGAQAQNPSDTKRRILANIQSQLARGGTLGANAHTVWAIGVKPYREAHFATFPPELARRCILAGSRVGDLVLDPFGGSGTTRMVAQQHGRRAISLDVSLEYAHLARARLA